MNRDDCTGESAAYVLGALEPDEAERYRRHLVGCAACREEVASMRPLTDALLVAVPQYRAPAGLRRRVMRTVHARPPRRRKPVRLAITAAAVAASLAAAIIFAQRPAPGGPAAQVRTAGGHAELSVQHLASPAPGRIYEVWLERPRAAPAPTTALFTVNHAGAADVAVPGDLRGVRELLVTEEPAGGSRVPTGLPVIVAPTG
jgi:Anti-sigma-K factor rskA/Putative zinc-finger